MNAITPTQSNVQAAIRAFLLDVLPPLGSDGNPIEVIAGVTNRVPEPKATSFVVMTVLRIDRLSTNSDDALDCAFTGSIAPVTASFTASLAPAPPGAFPGPSIMTAIAISGLVPVGAPLSGPGIAAGTVILQQLTGSPGGIGTYAVSGGSQNVAAAVMTAAYGLLTAEAPAFGEIAVGATVFGTGVQIGTTVMAFGSGDGAAGTYIVTPNQTVSTTGLAAGTKTLQQTAEVTVQLDFHSADNSASDMAQTVSTALRDEYATDFFAALDPPLNGVSPYYADDPRYMVFVNAEDQYEWRWVLEACFGIDQVVSVPQRYADSGTVTVKSVDATFPP